MQVTTTCIATLTADNLDKIAERAREIWAWFNTPEFELDQLIAECARYNGPWDSPRSTMAQPGVDFAVDGASFVTEGVRYLALNAAAGGMLVVPSPVDAAMHAAMAQSDWVERLREAGIRPRHRTSEEATMPAYTRGCLTDTLYERTYGEAPPERWWFDQATVDARAQYWADHQEAIGIHMDFGTGVKVDEEAFAGI